jgi:nucleoside-diphosphate-sugar epimerase
MNIAVTGSSGHIGSAVAARLGRIARIIGLDRRPGPFTTQLGEIDDHQLVREVVRGTDALVHTAGLHVPDLGKASAEQFRRVNVDATRELLEAARAAGVGRFVLLSTTSVYGCSSRSGPPATWADEDLPPEPEDEYDRTKLESEALCRASADARLSTVILRLARCFPEPAHEVAFYRLYRGVDRRDVADAHLRAVLAPMRGSTTVNIAGPSPFEPGDMAALWEDPWPVIERRVPGVRAGFERRGWPLPGRIDRVYPIGKATRELGYRPRVGITELMREAAIACSG